MSLTMKAVQIVKYSQPYTVNAVPKPDKLEPYDILVKIAVASFCHTDMMVHSGALGTRLPITAGHERAGTIVTVGSKVKGMKEGDRVMCGLSLGDCGTCDACVGPDDRRQYCQNREGGVGLTLNGVFAEYVRCDSRSSNLLPDSVNFINAAPLACAGRSVWSAILKTGLSQNSGAWIAIVGSGGGLGHIGIQFAKALGLRVIAIEARDDGLALSSFYEADIVLDARKGNDFVVRQVQELVPGGADGTINLTDHSTAAALACAITKMHCTMVQIAQPFTVEIPFTELIFRDIRIRGSLVASPGESMSMLNLVNAHGISVKTNIFHGFDEFDKLMELVHSGTMQGKAVLVVDDVQMHDDEQRQRKMP